ncbi:cytochrome c oxidase assembly protein [Bacterioplanoides sp.]|uniref:cytochrome c oxidase assembly protein n=1 Tax=Bacterioplanoides sp. TaxID=2066072 RepID=UPI003B001674
MPSSTTQQLAIQKTIRQLIGALVLMVLFTIAMVPLYDVFCDITGLNGRASGLLQPLSANTQIQEQGLENSDPARDIQFITQVGSGLAVSFYPLENSQQAQPGGKHQVHFRFKNLTNQALQVKAVPSVSPPQASRHVLKIECFCFQALTLKPAEQIDIPVVYFLSAEFPDDIPSMTLAYTLFPVVDNATDAKLVGG